MNTEQLIESCENKLIQLATRIERGYSVDPKSASGIAVNIRELREVLK